MTFAHHPGLSGTSLGRGTGDLNHNGTRGDRGDVFRDAHHINGHEARQMGFGSLHLPSYSGLGHGGLVYGGFFGYPLGAALRAETSLMRAQTNMMYASMAGNFLSQLLGGMGS